MGRITNNMLCTCAPTCTCSAAVAARAPAASLVSGTCQPQNKPQSLDLGARTMPPAEKPTPSLARAQGHMATSREQEDEAMGMHALLSYSASKVGRAQPGADGVDGAAPAARQAASAEARLCEAHSFGVHTRLSSGWDVGR